MDSLDSALGSLREYADIADQDSSVQLLNDLVMSVYGSDPSPFSTGVIFGLEFCQLGNLGMTTPVDNLYGTGPTAGSEDWVVTRGSLWDGEEVVNIDVQSAELYAFRLSIPDSLSNARECFAMGSVLYDINEKQILASFVGQESLEGPAALVLASDVDAEDLVKRALGEGFTDDPLRISSSSIRLGDFVMEIVDASATPPLVTIYGRSNRKVFPFPAGQPNPDAMAFAASAMTNLQLATTAGFDVNLVSWLMVPVVSAALWGRGGFYGFWTQVGRSCPDNVKHYYNAIFSPPLP